MSHDLVTLSTKASVDAKIRGCEDKVLVLCFSRPNDTTCLRCHEILAKTAPLLAKMAEIYLVEVDLVPVYSEYFDISLIPSTIFFFNGQHIKVDYGTQDHTKFIGAFATKQDFIDLVEVICRGAMRGKLIVTSPIDPQNVPKYQLIYNGI